MADYSKFLISKKTFSVFMEVKDFFKSDEVQFIKSEIRSRKLFNFIFEVKTNSPIFNRSKNLRSWYLKNNKENGIWILKQNLNNLISFLNSAHNEFNTKVRECDTFFFDRQTENNKLLIFNRLLETRAPSIIVRSPVILLWKQVLKLLIVWYLLDMVNVN